MVAPVVTTLPAGMPATLHGLGNLESLNYNQTEYGFVTKRFVPMTL